MKELRTFDIYSLPENYILGCNTVVFKLFFSRKSRSVRPLAGASQPHFLCTEIDKYNFVNFYYIFKFSFQYLYIVGARFIFIVNY